MIRFSLTTQHRLLKITLPLYLLLMAVLPSGVAAEDRDPEAIYHEFCSVCHGDKGDGQSRAKNSVNPPPRDFTTGNASIELTRERMIHAVTQGRPGTAMAGWELQLNKAEIEGVVDYVRKTFMMASTTEIHDIGRRLFAENCSVCHGDRGTGAAWTKSSLNPSPRDFTSERARRELTRERMLFSVTFGRPQTAMGGFETQLSKEEIGFVVDYVRTAFMQIKPQQDQSKTTMDGKHDDTGTAPHKHATPVDDLEDFMKEPYPDALQTNSEQWGAVFYNNNCATCHGVKGDGKGPRAYFIFPKPRDFRHPAALSSLNRPHLFEAIAKGSVGTEMPAWDKVLTNQEIADVSEYVFRKFIRPE